MTEAKMQEIVAYKPGTFCWVELGTSDGANAMWGWFLERMGGSR